MSMSAILDEQSLALAEGRVVVCLECRRQSILTSDRACPVCHGRLLLSPEAISSLPTFDATIVAGAGGAKAVLLVEDELLLVDGVTGFPLFEGVFVGQVGFTLDGAGGWRILSGRSGTHAECQGDPVLWRGLLRVTEQILRCRSLKEGLVDVPGPPHPEYGENLHASACRKCKDTNLEVVRLGDSNWCWRCPACGSHFYGREAEPACPCCGNPRDLVRRYPFDLGDVVPSRRICSDCQQGEGRVRWHCMECGQEGTIARESLPPDVAGVMHAVHDLGPGYQPVLALPARICPSCSTVAKVAGVPRGKRN